MSEVFFKDYNDNKDVYDKKSIFQAMCVCGHALYLHGFVRNFIGDAGLWVSQCTACPIVDGEFACKEFEGEDRDG